MPLLCCLWTDNETGHYDVSRSFDFPIFSLVDDDKALIKVNIDLIDLSHAVTDESDDTAFCQASIEFNSLDVIGQMICHDSCLYLILPLKFFCVTVLFYAYTFYLPYTGTVL